MKPLEPGDPETIGPYELMSRLGSGGMGEVFLGRSMQGELAAIKVARGEYADDAGFRRRFAREVDAARKVDGRFTAAVLSADPDARRPWLATAYIAASSLADAVTKEGTLPESSLRTLLAGTAAALEAIHAAGLTHRDLKPANVMLAPDGPRVIDFGISHSTDHSQITRTGQAPGTPGYMAPEQLRGAAVGAHTDVYALGATLVFAATGGGPFGQGDALTLLYRALEEEPQLDGVPAGLRDVIARCMAKDPAQRPTVASLRTEFSVPQSIGDEGKWLPAEMSTVVRLPQHPDRIQGEGSRGTPFTGGPAAYSSSHPQAPVGVYGPPPPTHGPLATPPAGTPAAHAPSPYPPSPYAAAYGNATTGSGSSAPGGAPGGRKPMSRRKLIGGLSAFGVMLVGGTAAAGILDSWEAGDGPGKPEKPDGPADKNEAGKSAGEASERADDSAAAGGEPGQDSGSLPKIVSGKEFGKKPTFEKKRGAKPKRLVVRTLIRGKGPKARKGNHINCHYVMQQWDKASVSDSSFKRGEPMLVQVGKGQVIKGWDKALIGRRKGSRLEFSVPPKLAYADEENAGIDKDATLLFVVDILDVIDVEG